MIVTQLNLPIYYHENKTVENVAYAGRGGGTAGRPPPASLTII